MLGAVLGAARGGRRRVIKASAGRIALMTCVIMRWMMMMMRTMKKEIDDDIYF